MRIIDIITSLSPHRKVQLIFIFSISIFKFSRSREPWSLSPISLGFSCTPLLAYLLEALLFLLQGESTWSWNFCILIAHERLLRFDSLLSLPKQLLELHGRMRMLITTCHVRLLLDVVIVICASLYLLLDLPNGIWLILPNVQLVIISALFGNFLAFPITSFKWLSLLSVCFSYSSVGNLISFGIG